MFGIPIKYGTEIIGSLVASCSDAHQSSLSKDSRATATHDARKMETFLTDLGGLAEETLVNRKEIDELAEELSQNFEDLSLYARITTQMRSLQFSGEMTKSLIKELQETLNVALAFVYMPNRQGYNAVASTADASDRISDEVSFTQRLVELIPEMSGSADQGYFIVNDSSSHPDFLDLHATPYRFLAVKVAHENTFEGWMGLVSFHMEDIFKQTELKLLQSMAKQISILLANLDLYHELEQFVINVVRSLVYTIEAKDVYTRGHSERVSRYSMLIADHLQMGEEEKHVLTWSSILHDIGKIGIPEALLNKPDRLTDEEFEVIKSHPQKGADILKPLEQLSSSLPGVLHHHERFDGCGYPQGLKGSDIPFLARIIAVADTFDAITSNRAYRSAKAAEKAMSIIDKVAGTQLDPQVVHAFRDIYHNKLKAEIKAADNE